MEKSITIKESTEVANPQLIKEAQSLSGEDGGTFIPFIPIIRVNKKEKKMVTVEGEETEMMVLPKAGFSVTRKDENTKEYTTEKFADKLEAVVLRVRYRIEEKYDKKNPTKKRFYSFEFDMIDPDIKVFDGETKTVIAQGNYQSLKNHFQTGKNESGFPTKSFNLIMVMYINTEGEDVYRFERNVTQNDAWYNYRNSFPRDDTFVAYKTKFVLTKETFGTVEFWKLTFKKGESVDLAKAIKLQKEINKFFFVSQSVKEQPKEDLPVIQLEEEINPAAPTENDIPPTNDLNKGVTDSVATAIPF